MIQLLYKKFKCRLRLTNKSPKVGYFKRHIKINKVVYEKKLGSLFLLGTLIYCNGNY